MREIQKVAQEPVSLETPVGEDEDSELGYKIEDGRAQNPPSAAAELLRRKQIDRVLRRPDPRTRKVLELRFRPARRGATDPGGGRLALRRHGRADPSDRGEDLTRLRDAFEEKGLRGHVTDL